MITSSVWLNLVTGSSSGRIRIADSPEIHILVKENK